MGKDKLANLRQRFCSKCKLRKTFLLLLFGNLEYTIDGCADCILLVKFRFYFSRHNIARTTFNDCGKAQ